MNQPLGALVENWKAPVFPPKENMVGRFCKLAPLDVERDAKALYEAFSLDTAGANWTYLPYGPFESFTAFEAWLITVNLGNAPLFFTIFDLKTDKAVGVGSYLRIDPKNGSIEVGHLNFSPLLQRTPIATEAMYLMMKNAFDLGYRRYEWKCNDLNEPSKNAALRYGFTYEGTFRQSNVIKGRNRDTAWYSVIDTEWQSVQAAFETWLSPDNFYENGLQKKRLKELY
jgi:RimJ/RimL family protein N-acetyltransferase